MLTTWYSNVHNKWPLYCIIYANVQSYLVVWSWLYVIKAPALMFDIQIEIAEETAIKRAVKCDNFTVWNTILSTPSVIRISHQVDGFNGVFVLRVLIAVLSVPQSKPPCNNLDTWLPHGWFETPSSGWLREIRCSNRLDGSSEMKTRLFLSESKSSPQTIDPTAGIKRASYVSLRRHAATLWVG